MIVTLCGLARWCFHYLIYVPAVLIKNHQSDIFYIVINPPIISCNKGCKQKKKANPIECASFELLIVLYSVEIQWLKFRWNLLFFIIWKFPFFVFSSFWSLCGHFSSEIVDLLSKFNNVLYFRTIQLLIGSREATFKVPSVHYFVQARICAFCPVCQRFWPTLTTRSVHWKNWGARCLITCFHFTQQNQQDWFLTILLQLNIQIRLASNMFVAIFDMN